MIFKYSMTETEEMIISFEREKLVDKLKLIGNTELKFNAIFADLFPEHGVEDMEDVKKFIEYVNGLIEKDFQDAGTVKT